MKAKHAKTLRSLFAKPTLASIAFSDIESLLLSMGAQLHEREGSRVKFQLGSEEWHAHRPHPGKEAKKYHNYKICGCISIDAFLGLIHPWLLQHILVRPWASAFCSLAPLSLTR